MPPSLESFKSTWPTHTVNMVGPGLCASSMLGPLLKSSYIGNVVRVSPNALSFSSVKAMEGIYVYSNKNDIFLKGTVYDGLALNSSTPNMRSLLTEKNPEKHADIRKYFGPCFSPTGLAEQEESITTLVDVFISKMYKYSSKPLEIGWWYHCLAFDITGKLSLGESFGSTKTGTLRLTSILEHG